MALKWKKDGTAKCGDDFVYLQTNYGMIPRQKVRWTWRYKLSWGIADSKEEAQLAAESWLRKQANAMLRDCRRGK